MPRVSGSVERQPELSVRLVVADHYMTRPISGIDVIYSEFRGADIKQVPVLRIFGPASDGHKACLHVHGVFPYFYIPCGVSNPEPQLLYQIAASLDKALNISMKQANSVNQHVYKITLVKGMPFYGFHYKEHLFFKIFLYNPGLIKQAVELFNNGAILGQVFQPHEAHLNFTLQFFIDFNLFGMSSVDMQTVKFRKKPSDCTEKSSGEMFSSSDETSVKAESCCYYEADVLASHIINRQRVGKGDGIENPGLEEVWSKELERRKQLNMTLSSKSLTQYRVNDETESHYKFEKMFWLKISNLIEKPVDVSPTVEEPAYYPAESMEGSQLFNASDVSLHQPCDTLESTMSEIIRDDNTIVDENVALNCSIAEQLTLDSEDLDFVEILKDMEQPVDDDSILGTQVQSRQETEDLVDAEYSQIFNNTTVVQDNSEKFSDNTVTVQENTEEKDTEDDVNWNDSFWDGANIPQLDGNFDDEHTKNVRKRKLPRTRSLGLSHPKAKTKITITKSLEGNNKSNLDSINEIGTSQTSIDDIINERYINVAIESQKNTVTIKAKNSNKNEISEEITRSVEYKLPLHLKESQHNIENIDSKVKDKAIQNCCGTKLETSVLYDLKNNFEPQAGPSNVGVSGCTKNIYEEHDEIIDNSFESNSTTDKGIHSFYDISKIFDTSLDDNDINSTGIEGNKIKLKSDKDELPTKIKMEKVSPSKTILDQSTFIRLQQTSSTIKTLSSGTDISQDTPRIVILTPKLRPPTRKDIVSSLNKYNIPANINQEPYYSNYKDVGSKIEIGQMVLKISSKAAQHQKPFPTLDDYKSIEEWRKYLFLEHNGLSQEIIDISTLKSLLAGNRKCILEPVQRPPNAKEVKKWLESKEDLKVSQKDIALEQVELSKDLDELDNPQAIGLEAGEMNKTFSLEDEDAAEQKKSDLNESLQVSMQPDGSYLCYGGAVNQNDTLASETPSVECDFLTLMAMEIHAAVRQDLNPDPQFDAMQAIFISVTNDSPPNHFLARSITEVIVADANPNKLLEKCGLSIPITYVKDESAIIEHVLATVKKWDPDILCAYEIELNSWGYLLERSEVLGIDIISEISRITEKHRQKKWRSEDKSYEGRILGRVIFNVWRMLRHELALSSYSFESTMYHILKERVPSYSYSSLAEWWAQETKLLRWMTVEYYLTRLSGTIRMLEKLDMINRTSELARLFGLQWWEVLSRGSQFRVESLMLRAARPLNLIALSPSVKQRAAMKAPECLPLIFEPESRFYSDPVIVLDFQSLYPSMMIAYNYCFSTCIGKAQNISGDHSYEFGAWRLRIPRDKLEALVKNNYVHWSPVGAGFVSPAVRRGVLPALLRRILAARQAVKKSMKMQTDEAVKKAMHSRQLGLKLIANVTYGYTAANFSGRMPCVEIGDSVVAKGRETLERAIKLVEKGNRWNAKVVYGDTDSMFVLVPGGDRREAFRIGQEIADAVTADNPSPVALKLEKVYQPCILQTKKRYVGYMYESSEQQTPVYEAKGIETVRRDGCPATVKLLQQSLCELFSSGDVSKVKRLVTSTLSRLVDGQMPVQELFFTREYNGVAGYRPGAAAPPLEIARRLARKDRRSVPRTGERVSWAVCAGAPGLPLVRLARTPLEIHLDVSLRPHTQYYITRVVLPPLHRCLSLIGADVFKWYTEIPHRTEAGVGGIVQYMWRETCLACGQRATRSICRSCVARPQHAALAVTVSVQRDTACYQACDSVCQSCCGHSHHSLCVNTECPVLWRRQTARLKLQQTAEAVRVMPPPLCCSELF